MGIKLKVFKKAYNLKYFCVAEGCQLFKKWIKFWKTMIWVSH